MSSREVRMYGNKEAWNLLHKIISNNLQNYINMTPKQIQIEMENQGITSDLAVNNREEYDKKVKEFFGILELKEENKEDLKQSKSYQIERLDELKTKELTYGEKYVGLKFNPSNLSNVDQIKKECAKVIDTIEEEYIKYNNEILNSTKSNKMMSHGIIERLEWLTSAKIKALEVQMLVVKAMTFN